MTESAAVPGTAAEPISHPGARVGAVGRLRRRHDAVPALHRRLRAGRDRAVRGRHTCTSGCTTHATSSASPATDAGAERQHDGTEPASSAACSSGWWPAWRRSASPAGRVSRASTRRSPSRYCRARRAPRDPGGRRGEPVVQDSAGLGTGAMLFGVAMGGMFALVFSVAYGRIGPAHGPGTAAAAGPPRLRRHVRRAAAEVPAQPPAVGSNGHDRTANGAVPGDVAAVGGCHGVAVMVRRRIVPRFGEWNATLLVGAGYIVAMGVCSWCSPGSTRCPRRPCQASSTPVTDAGVTFPPSVLWNFRIASLGIQLVMWTAIALAFGAAAQRLLEPDRRRPERTPAMATSQD